MLVLILAFKLFIIFNSFLMFCNASEVYYLQGPIIEANRSTFKLSSAGC